MNFAIVICHFVSDWILQPRAVAKNKTRSLSWMLKHLVVIHATFTVLSLFAGVPQWAVVLNTLSHGLIDKTVWTCFRVARGPFTEEYLEKNLYAEDYWFYFTIAVDQIFHMTILFWLFT